MIAPDAEVRVIAAFVDQLNLQELGFNEINSMGASAYGSGPLKRSTGSSVYLPAAKT